MTVLVYLEISSMSSFKLQLCRPFACVLAQSYMYHVPRPSRLYRDPVETVHLCLARKPQKHWQEIRDAKGGYAGGYIFKIYSEARTSLKEGVMLAS
jgi:hypothetical protein